MVDDDCPNPPADGALGAPKVKEGVEAVGVWPNGVEAPNGAGEMGDWILSAGF